MPKKLTGLETSDPGSVDKNYVQLKKIDGIY